MSLEKKIRKYLDEICIESGFCLPMHEIEKLATKKYYEADEFVRDIFVIEGMDPDMELHHFRQVKKKFTDRFGSEVQQ